MSFQDMHILSEGVQIEAHPPFAPMHDRRSRVCWIALDLHVHSQPYFADHWVVRGKVKAYFVIRCYTDTAQATSSLRLSNKSHSE